MTEKKIVLVTAAAKGTGYAIAKRFAEEGYHAILTSRREADAALAAERLMQEVSGAVAYGRALSSDGDSKREEAEIDALLLEFADMGYPALSCIVCNAANLGIAQDTLECDIAEYELVIHTNLIWNYLLARRAARDMKEAGGGAIVFINSNTAYRAIPLRSAYSASKSGVLGLSRTLALDLGKYNIRSNCVLPGMIKTDRWQTNYNNCRAAPSNYTPLGDIAEFEDIANAAYFLGSEQSRNTTGAELVVDGGNMIQLYPIIPEE